MITRNGVLIPLKRVLARDRVVWFNTEWPHEELDDFTPEAVEKLHYDHRRALPEAG